ncbi:MAG: sulfite exporter TauE/SafE family protein [Deltaproteobacteria bacterium]|nr:sulfite exporter TauE/SafE family protein [Deltaproteobacteria bacterium]
MVVGKPRTEGVWSAQEVKRPMDPFVFLLTLILAFLAEYVDASLGMGFGTTLGPLLLILGFAPSEIIPSLIVAQFISNICAVIFHHRFGNVDLRFGSAQLKVALILSGTGVFGSLVAVLLSRFIGNEGIKSYMALSVVMFGFYLLFKTLFNRKTVMIFSWGKIIGLGLFAAFNKGLTGGGYGPIITSGQILTGISGKSAVGVTAFSEAVTCVAAVLAYLHSGSLPESWLLFGVSLGSVISVPFSALTVRKLPDVLIRTAIGLFSIIIGLLLFAKF